MNGARSLVAVAEALFGPAAVPSWWCKPRRTFHWRLDLNGGGRRPGAVRGSSLPPPSLPAGLRGNHIPSHPIASHPITSRPAEGHCVVVNAAPRIMSIKNQKLPLD